jgi:pilus assembly protein TadC
MSTTSKLGKKAGYVCLAIGICMLIVAIGICMLIVTIWAFSQPIFAFYSYILLRIIVGFDIFVFCASILAIIGIKKRISAMRDNLSSFSKVI